ncbi:MAG: UDP-N-acetylmuramoyl-L-alanyl-D-glutamate--2,6-diaminopimelate ligase [Phycisphaerales bacterium]|nr:UDP-N-acetylmuramoyl-L-alanyl-D-glutamate--2,6-diaminopimelate ligase [Phycisphaerales bacterium]
MTIDELIHGLDIERIGDPSARICDLTEDSTTVMPGSLFVARKGLAADGRRYIADAIAAGAGAVLTDDAASVPTSLRPRITILTASDLPNAAAAIADRFYGSPSRELSLVGITGTNGKTTVTHLVHHVVNHAGIRCGMIGTVAVDDGSELTAAEMTTPPALEINRTLSQMVEAGCGAAVIEVSSHAIDQKRAAALAFDVGVFTNLTGDHLDYHGTMEAYAATKATFFAALPPDAVAVVNIDDPHAHRMLADCRARVVRCASQGPDDIDATVAVHDATMDGVDLTLTGPWGVIDAHVALVGRHNAMNILQAAVTAHAMGVSAEQLQAGLETCAPPPGRLEAVTTPESPFAVFVDYAHTDDALDNVLRTVRPLVPTGGDLFVVFGCGGDRDVTKRPRMARVACSLADRIVITSDNPRTEQPERIIDQVMTGVPYAKRDRVTRRTDRADAIDFAMRSAKAGDIIVIAGKGHEDCQIVPDSRGGTLRLPFDDRIQARAVLRSIGITPAPLPQPALHARDDAVDSHDDLDHELFPFEASSA